MIVREHVSLSELTTLRVGGPVRFVIDCEHADDVREAVAFAREHALPLAPLGEGSNVLSSDEGFVGVVVRMQDASLSIESRPDGELLTAGAGMHWDTFVRTAAERGLWGIENLAGIPGTVGAAPVQNIGAYGAELAAVLAHVDAYDTNTGDVKRIAADECGFGYRDSRFKHEPNLIILAATFSLATQGTPQLGYKDLAECVERGEALTTPLEIGDAVRRVRAGKFPDLSVCGTAGSFFKNPILAPDAFAALAKRYGAVPSFPADGGIKVPLAFILDRVLKLRGYREGNVSLFGNQPLVLVADADATADEIDAFANAIAARVHAATGISIEREVRYFPAI